MIVRYLRKDNSKQSRESCNTIYTGRNGAGGTTPFFRCRHMVILPCILDTQAVYLISSGFDYYQSYKKDLR